MYKSLWNHKRLAFKRNFRYKKHNLRYIFAKKSIKNIAKNAEKSPKFGQLFFRLIQFFEFKSIFDLGTSLGITTAYLAFANTGLTNGLTRNVEVKTFEGCPETAKIATENFEKLGIKNVEIIIGNLDETLAKKVAETEKIDFVFFDANHRFEPTIKYFEICLTKAHEESLFVFDDIYWSAEMAAAWQEIKNHPKVSVTIDLFFVGLVFFRKKQPKQHFVLKF